MKTVNFFAKAFVALTLAFAAQAPAQAQLGNLLNKAKNAAQEKAKEVVTDQAGKAAGQVTAKSAQEVLGEAPARPWVLDESQSGNMERLIGALGGMNQEKTKEFGEQISARAEYDAKLLAGMENKTIIEDAELKKQAKKELELADKFYGLVLKSGATYGPVGMKKNAQGDWAVVGALKLPVPGSDYSVTIQADEAVFCTKDSYDAALADDAAVQAAKVAFTTNLNMGWLLEGYAKGKSEEFEQAYYRATFAANTYGKAVVNNKKEVVDRVNKARAEAVRRAEAEQKASQASSGGSGSGSGRPAKRIQGSNSNVTAYSGSTQIGTAKLSGSNISVYTKGSTGATGVIHSSSIDFRGTSNRYRISKVGEELRFYGANGGNVGSVQHNKNMRKYEVKREGSTATIAEFDDSLDPRFAALFFYNFFD